MAIVVENVNAWSWGDNNSDITPTVGTPTEGNLLLGIAMRRSSTAGTGVTYTNDASYTKLLEYQAGRIVVWAKKAGASESDPTFTHDNANANNPWGAGVIEISGADVDNLGSIVHTNTSGRQDSAVSTHTFDGMTITEDGVILIDIGNASSNRTHTPTASPAYDERYDDGTTNGSDATAFVQTRIQTTASSVSSHTAILNSTTVSSALSLALLPASTGSIAPQAGSLRRFMGIQ